MILNGKAKVQAKKDKEPPPERANPQPKKPPKVSHDFYYDLIAGKYWRPLLGDYVPAKEEGIARKLRAMGFVREAKHDNSLTFLEQELEKIHENASVLFACELAGYDAGEHTVCGSRILCTRGPKLPQPAAGKFPVLAKFLGELFPDAAKPHFLGWLKIARRSLEAGPPWQKGQAVALCGPPGCGKNLLQAIITEILGGRLGKPYDYMSGKTDFNRDLFAAEHLCIQDEVEHVDWKARRFFAARIKDITVNDVHRYHPKGKDAYNLTPFWRLTVSLNDETENLQILPPLESGTADKLMLFKCRATDLPIDPNDDHSRRRFWDTLVAELPAFLYWLKRWKIPENIRDRRFGVVAYHEKSMVDDIGDLTPEAKFLSLLETAGLWDLGDPFWVGSARQLENLLREKFGQEARDLLKFANAGGTYLERLSKQLGERIVRIRGENNTRLWEIHKTARFAASTNGKEV